MLIPLDDYPVHQTPEPVAHTLGGAVNHYDRYFFNGYRRDGSLYFGAALGLYPNRRVMDAAFAVVRDGEEISVIASRLAPLDRETTVGPIRVTVEEPLRRLRVSVSPNESGLEADLVFTARSVALEEPRFTRYEGASPVFDYTRLTQWGTWSGTLVADGERVDVTPDVMGCRDRSWGLRPVGQQVPGPSGSVPQFFWLWAPLNFDDLCVHFDVNEDGEGRPWHWNGVVMPVLRTPGDPLVDPGSARHMARVRHDIRWEPGTRRAASATLHLEPHDGEPLAVHLEPMLTFRMRGLGYLHPEWGHGHWKGDEALHTERFRLDDVNPLDPFYVHVQQVCRATMGERSGVGVFEQLVIGPHGPSGFREMLDGAPAQ
ncbi:MAG: hypothetical protein M5U14_01225 [Acidimicrobiia bacterium]|nr:hypothetical protein [Acidimicrobiia bacterium]